MTTRITLHTIPSALLVLALALLAPAASAQTGGATPAPASASYPAWAYPWAPDFQVPTPDDAPQRLPGSTAAFSWVQARDLFFSPSWHPEDHPSMPDVVARGRKPDVRACGSCHRAEGTGGPENASLAGLPAAYFVQQMADFKSGARKFSGPNRSAVLLMNAAAKAMTDEEVQAAAAYFASLKPKRVIKVVESESAPATYIARLFFVKSPQGGTEPLGRRIVEVPDDFNQFELRDTRSMFTAHVPLGSVARGAALAKTGGEGTTIPCAACHGPDLTGLGPIPGIAGRSPSYLMRQLFDFKNGARGGPGSAQMQATVAHLPEGDMLALAAYVASLPPGAPAVASTDIKVLSVQPLKPLLDELGPEFERATGHKLSIKFDVSAALKRQIDAGEAFDVALILPAIVDDLLKQGKVAAGTRADIARAAIGVAVKRGAPKPDIGSAEALKRALLNAASIAYSGEGASGIYFKTVLERLGIAAETSGKLKPLASSAVVPAVANGDVELAVISPPAILAEPGAELVGILPKELQNYVVYTAGVSATAKDADAAKALIKYLTTPAAVSVMKSKGLEPAVP